MEKVELITEPREGTGTSYVKKLRAQDKIPAVLYKKGENAISLTLDKLELLKVLHTAKGENVIVALTVKGSKKAKTRTVIVKEVQRHPIRDEILHVDFNEISLKEKITVKIPIQTKGESKGVKEGGILEHTLWEVEVECFPTQIPENVTVDISELEIGDVVHVRDLVLPEDVKLLTDPEQAVVTIESPVMAEVEETAAEEEAAEVSELEVISEKERETEEAAESEDGKGAGKKGS